MDRGMKQVYPPRQNRADSPFNAGTYATVPKLPHERLDFPHNSWLLCHSRSRMGRGGMYESRNNTNVRAKAVRRASAAVGIRARQIATDFRQQKSRRGEDDTTTAYTRTITISIGTRQRPASTKTARSRSSEQVRETRAKTSSNAAHKRSDRPTDGSGVASRRLRVK
jgi:hypothetical protein